MDHKVITNKYVSIEVWIQTYRHKNNLLWKNIKYFSGINNRAGEQKNVFLLMHIFTYSSTRLVSRQKVQNHNNSILQYKVLRRS